MKKKILSLILAVLMATSSAAVAAADEVLTTAAPANAAHAASAEFLATQGIMKGKDNGELALNDDIKRYEMALFVSRISTGWTDDKQWDNGMVNNTGFTDLEGSGAINAMGAITYAVQKGIIEGYGNGEFGPEDGITYQDALTMAVRTLGYKDLGWPWEYIEKAIELGITKNVTDKAYTKVLNRGEVAQLIYNTLNTEKKSGSTLAFDVFNMAEATIMITASDRAVFEKGANPAPNGKVAFKTFDVATGALGTITYYANAAEFALNGENADELAVGYVYKALLNTDDNGNIQNAADGSIVKGYTATEKFEFVNANGENGIAEVAKTLAAVKVYNATEKAFADVNYGGVAMDWNTGDLLVECLQDDGYTYVSADGKFYKVAWYWNAAMHKYFRFKTDTNLGIVGIEWLENDELAEAIEALKAENTANRRAGFTLIKDFHKATAMMNTAYAELDLQKFAGDEAYINGVYQEFKLGYIKTASKVKCTCGKDHAGYEILNVVDDMVASYAGENSYLQNGTLIEGVAVSAATCTTAGHGVWFSKDAAPADPAGAFVIYGYNEQTEELKIVKTLEKQYGILRAYSINKAQALIGDKIVDLGYTTLNGACFNDMHSNKSADKEKYLDGFDALINMYVEYVEVDGKVVSIRAAEQTEKSDKYIIMQEFVGLTEDGTIVVEAYSTSTGALTRYLVNSFNGWKKGSYNYQKYLFYYEDLFAAGALYYVHSSNGVSVDVELFGCYDENGNYVIDESKIALADKSYAFTLDGLKIVDGKTAEKDLKENNGTYIVIAQTKVEGRAPITVYTGEVYDVNWEISGKILKNVAGADVFVAVDEIYGFDADSYMHGMYLYTNGRIWEAAFENDAHDTFFGAVEELIVPTETYITVEVTDLYTGKVIYKTLRNITKEEVLARPNTVYVTVGNNVEAIWAPSEDAANAVEAMANIFYTDAYVDALGRADKTSADYLFGTLDVAAGAKIDAKAIRAALVADGYYAEELVARRANIDKFNAYLISTTEDGATVLEAITTAPAGATLTYVFDPHAAKNSNVVVYAVMTGDVVETEPVETEPVETEPSAPVEGATADVVVTINFAATENVNSIAFADLTYDANVLTFVGFGEVGADDITNKHAFGGAANAIDADKNTVIIGLMAAEALSGKVVDLIFTAKADSIEAIEAAVEAVEFARIIVKNGSTEVDAYEVTKAAEVVDTTPEAPVETEPVETEPVETEPVETEPVETEPVETEPVETEPVETEPVETEPVETEPVETEPVETEQVFEQVYDLQFNMTSAKAAVGEEVVVSIKVASKEGIKANSIALATLTYDAAALEFVGYENYGDIANKHAFGGAANAIDTTLNNIIIGLMAAEEMNGAICDLRFKVLAAGETTVTFASSVAKENSTAINNGIVPATIVAE